jgi:hypothetical protein
MSRPRFELVTSRIQIKNCNAGGNLLYVHVVLHMLQWRPISGCMARVHDAKCFMSALPRRNLNKAMCDLSAVEL